MFRRYEKDDIKNIVNLEKETLHSTLDYSFYENDLANDFAYHFVLIENEFIGFVSSVFDGEIAEILNFCVEPKYQGMGYGYKILDSYLKHIFSLGGNSVVLEVRSSNVKAFELYKKCGFRVIRIRKAYYSNGEDALYMMVDLGELYGKN